MRTHAFQVTSSTTKTSATTCTSTGPTPTDRTQLTTSLTVVPTPRLEESKKNNKTRANTRWRPASNEEKTSLG